MKRELVTRNVLISQIDKEETYSGKIPTESTFSKISKQNKHAQKQNKVLVQQSSM